MRNAWITTEGAAAARALNQDAGDVHAPSLREKRAPSTTAEPPPAPRSPSRYRNLEDVALSIVVHHQHTNIVSPDTSGNTHHSPLLADSATMTAQDAMTTTAPLLLASRNHWMPLVLRFPLTKALRSAPAAAKYWRRALFLPSRKSPRMRSLLPLHRHDRERHPPPQLQPGRYPPPRPPPTPPWTPHPAPTPTPMGTKGRSEYRHPPTLLTLGTTEPPSQGPPTIPSDPANPSSWPALTMMRRLHHDLAWRLSSDTDYIART